MRRILSRSDYVKEKLNVAGWCSGSTPARTTGERRIDTAGLPPRVRRERTPHGHSASFSMGHARSAAAAKNAADVAPGSWAGEDPAKRQPGQTGPPGWGPGRLYMAACRRGSRSGRQGETPSSSFFLFWGHARAADQQPRPTPGPGKIRRLAGKPAGRNKKKVNTWNRSR